MLTLLVLYLFSGGLLFFLALPLLNSRVPPNPFYGFRIPSTLRDPQLWYAVNRFGAVRLITAAASLVIASVLLYFLPGISVDQYALACLAVFGTVFTAGLIQSLRYLRSLQQARDRHQQ
jgi:hypothetical protein